MTLEVPHDIQSASSYINNILVTKGYIQSHEALRFWSQQLAGEGTKEDEEDAEMQDHKDPFETAVSNDRVTLNLINSLLETIESDSTARETLMNRAEQAQKSLDGRDQHIQRLTSRCEALDQQLTSLNRLNRTLESAKRTLESSNKTIREDLARMKSLQLQSKAQFANELRKRDVQIARLKQRLQDPLARGSSGASGGKPLTGASGIFSSAYNTFSAGQGVLLSSQALTASNSSSGTSGTSNLGNNSDNDLLPLLRALAQENSMLYGLAYKTRLVIENVVHYGFRDLKLELSADEMDNIESLGYDIAGGADKNELVTNSARVIRRTINVAQLGAETSQSLQKLSEHVNSSEMVPAAEVERKDKEIQELQNQVESVTANWQRAIKTMDEWKAFRSRDK